MFIHCCNCVVAENVAGLLEKHMPVLQKIITCMEQCGYVVQVKLVNMHGWVPQRRRRVYVVAIRSDAYAREFRWPVASEKKLSFSKTIVYFKADMVYFIC